MEKLLVLDARNYEEDMGEINRVGVRGIIFKNGKLLLTQDNHGEVKLPGGGQDKGENDEETLIREVKEETGYSVIPSTIKEFGIVEEKRLSIKEPMIWHQINKLYICEVGDEQGECSYSPHEIRFGFRVVWYTVDEAIAQNEAMFEREGRLPQTQREYNCLKLVKKMLEDGGAV